MTSKPIIDRAANRLSMLFFVDCFLAGDVSERIRVRNMSETGLGGDFGGEILLVKGQRIEICFYGTVYVQGHVAWANGNRIGVHFEKRIDLAQLRLRGGGPTKSYEAPERVKPADRFWRPRLK